MRRKNAKFPTGKTFSSWRPEESSISEATQNALTTLEWVHRRENLAVSGAGTGKSHFVEALAHAAIEADLRVLWFTLETLTQTVNKAKADGSVGRTVAKICSCDLVVVDDIGMLPAGQDAAEAFYRIVDAAYERRSVAVTSNIHPSGFDTIMPKTLATATVDNRSMRGFHRFDSTGVTAFHQLNGCLWGETDTSENRRVDPGILE
jgi:DNA replication protein DnaC